MSNPNSNSPAPPAPGESFIESLNRKVAAARFLSGSMLLHAIIVVFFGGTILFEQAMQPPDFVAASGPLTADDSNLPDAPDDTIEITTDNPATLDSVTAVSTVDVIATTSLTSNSFAMPSVPAFSNKNGIGKGLGDQIKSGVANATLARHGGTRTPFGMKESSPDALAGTFYDLKQTRRGKPTGITPDDYHKVFRRFVSENWRESILDDYFKAPQTLYATQIMIPNMPADEGPRAFDLGKEVKPSRWLVHYRAKVSPPEDGVYHFVGAGDDVMIVRFNGKTVLDRCWHQQSSPWQPARNYDYGWTKIPNGFAKGDAIRVRAGQWYDIEILIGEQPGGLVFACLLIEKEGVEYEKDARGNPILPVFRVADLPMPPLKDGQTLPPYQGEGPVWRAKSSGSARTGASLLDAFRSPQ
jgi:hypothetical protein